MKRRSTLFPTDYCDIARLAAVYEKGTHRRRASLYSQTGGEYHLLRRRGSMKKVLPVLLIAFL
ncbi:MAG TPA: hypothetical protein P5142_17590, partial [Spirochaetia bacterium]|nr:hypothetical protein [Spirochaetia bacterium]